jgi:glucans biosynthesis protein
MVGRSPSDLINRRTKKPQPGQELLFSYRLHWGTRMPLAPGLAQVVATRTGIGGVVGQKRKYFAWRFVVDFVGGNLAGLPLKAKVEPVITASRGKLKSPRRGRKTRLKRIEPCSI